MLGWGGRGGRTVAGDRGEGMGLSSSPVACSSSLVGSGTGCEDEGLELLPETSRNFPTARRNFGEISVGEKVMSTTVGLLEAPLPGEEGEGSCVGNAHNNSSGRDIDVRGAAGRGAVMGEADDGGVGEPWEHKEERKENEEREEYEEHEEHEEHEEEEEEEEDVSLRFEQNSSDIEGNYNYLEVDERSSDCSSGGGDRSARHSRSYERRGGGGKGGGGEGRKRGDRRAEGICLGFVVDMVASASFGGLLFLTVLLVGSPWTGDEWAPSPGLGAGWTALKYARLSCSLIFCFVFVLFCSVLFCFCFALFCFVFVLFCFVSFCFSYLSI